MGLVVFAVLTAALWAAGYTRARDVLRGVSRLADLHPPVPARWPRLSVVVAARDEQGAVEEATRSLLALDYPGLQVVVVDDRSTDRTGAILDALAAEDPRLRVVHLDALPPGWLGKVHALHVGLGCAEGEWLLLTDADVHFAPDALRRAVAVAEQRQLDHFTLIPRVEASAPLLKAMQVWFGLHLVVFNRVDRVHDPASPAYLGSGAFNLVRREALVAIGGLEALRLEVLDDLGLGYRVKRAGFRSDAALGHGQIRLTWYADVKDMVRGVEKNAYAAFAGYSPARLVGVVGVVLGLEVLGPLSWLALGLWGPGWPWAAAVGALALVPFARALRLLCRLTGNPGWVALLFPAAAVLVMGALLRSGVKVTQAGGVSWRGTFYPLEALRAGRVIDR